MLRIMIGGMLIHNLYHFFLLTLSAESKVDNNRFFKSNFTAGQYNKLGYDY